MSSRVSPSSLRAWLVAALLVAGTFALFSRAVPYGFLNYDDPSYVTNNLHVRAGLTWESVHWAFTGHADYWHPLTWLSHMLDWQLFGGDARGHRAVSIAWHALNAVLLFLVVRRLTGAFWTSAALAAWFAWHPQRVESVVWVTERKDVMSGCFFLLTLAAYSHYARHADDPAAPRRSVRGWYGLTLAGFALGLMAKPMLVSLPLVLLVVDLWPLRRATPGFAPEDRRRWRRLGAEKLPFLALSVVIAGITVRMQHEFGAFTLELPFGARLGNAVVSLVRYAGKLVWPSDLSVVYPHPGYWPAALVAGAALLGAAAAVWAWRGRTTRPWWLAGLAWHVVVLAPVLGLVQVGFQAMADRYSYLALLGPALALLWMGRQWAGAVIARRWLAGAVVVAGLAAVAVGTWREQRHWRSSIALFERALEIAERNDVAHGFLGYTWLGEKQLDRAESHCRRALELNPRNTVALYTLAAVQEARGQPESAVETLRRLVAVQPRDLEGAELLGTLLLRLQRPAEAEAVFRAASRVHSAAVPVQVAVADAVARQGRGDEAAQLYAALLAVHPDEPKATNNYAVLLAVLGQAAEAERWFQRALELTPELPATHTNYGDFLAAARRWPEALSRYERALALGATDGATLFGIALAQERLGHSDEAARSFPRALAADPGNAFAHRCWAEGLARRGRMEEAITEYRAAVQLAPRDAAAHAGLGYVLVLTGRRDEGAQQWEEALRLDPEFPELRRRLQAMGR